MKKRWKSFNAAARVKKIWIFSSDGDSRYIPVGRGCAQSVSGVSREEKKKKKKSAWTDRPPPAHQSLSHQSSSFTCGLCSCNAITGRVCRGKTKKKVNFKCNQVFPIKDVSVSLTKKNTSLNKCSNSLLWSCIKALQLNVGKNWKKGCFLSQNKTITSFSLSCTCIQTLL